MVENFEEKMGGVGTANDPDRSNSLGEEGNLTYGSPRLEERMLKTSPIFQPTNILGDY